MENNFTLPAFAEPITTLPDTPNLSASELKRRFQAPSEELREVHNALAKAVQGITDATYPETVSESMLTADLAGKINGKAEQTALDAAETRVSALETDLPRKCEVYCGTYTGNGAYPRNIDLGFQPKAVFVTNMSGYMSYSANGNPYYYGGLALAEQKSALFEILENGFQICKVSGNVNTNNSGSKYLFLAFR